MPIKVWDKIANQFPIFNNAIVDVWEWISDFISHLKMDMMNDYDAGDVDVDDDDDDGDDDDDDDDDNDDDDDDDDEEEKEEEESFN